MTKAKASGIQSVSSTTPAKAATKPATKPVASSDDSGSKEASFLTEGEARDFAGARGEVEAVGTAFVGRKA